MELLASGSAGRGGPGVPLRTLEVNQRACASLPCGQAQKYRVAVRETDVVIALRVSVRLGAISVRCSWENHPEDIARVELKGLDNARLELQRMGSSEAQQTQHSAALLINVESTDESSFELSADMTVSVVLAAPDQAVTVVAGPTQRAYVKVRVPAEDPEAAFGLVRVDALPPHSKGAAGEPRVRMLASFGRVLPTDADAQWRSEEGPMTVPVAAATAAGATTLFVAICADVRCPLAVSYTVLRRRPSSSPPFAACAPLHPALPAMAPLPAPMRAPMPAPLSRPAVCSSPSPPASLSGFTAVLAGPSGSVSPPRSRVSSHGGASGGERSSASSSRRPSSPRPHWFAGAPALDEAPELEAVPARGRSSPLPGAARVSIGDPRDLSPAMLPPSPPSADPARDPGGEAWPEPPQGPAPASFSTMLALPGHPHPHPHHGHHSQHLLSPPDEDGGCHPYGARRYSFPSQGFSAQASLLHDALEHARRRRFSVADSLPSSASSSPRGGRDGGHVALSVPASPRPATAASGSPLLLRRRREQLEVHVGADAASPLPNGGTLRRLEFVVPQPSDEPAPAAAAAAARRSPLPAPLLRFTPPVEVGAAGRPAPQAVRVQAPSPVAPGPPPPAPGHSPPKPPPAAPVPGRPSPHAFSAAPGYTPLNVPPPAPRAPLSAPAGAEAAPLFASPPAGPRSTPLSPTTGPGTPPRLAGLRLPPRALEGALDPPRTGLTPVPSPACLGAGLAAAAAPPATLRVAPGLSHSPVSPS